MRGAAGERPDLRRALIIAGGFTALLWAVRLMETVTGAELYGLGVYPRVMRGLIGVLTAPLVHSSWSHLIANTLPLLVLGTALLYGYPRAARLALPGIYLGSGVGLWLFGRASYHIGASGLTHGLMFFVFVSGVLRRDRLSIALALIVFFLYGGMVWSIFPQDPHISFEYHFFGAAMGVLMAFLLRRRDPPPPAKRYDWEDEDDEASEDPLIGDQWRGPDPPKLSRGDPEM